MILGLIVILACQLLGEFLVALLGLRIPGPVVGLALLVPILAARGQPFRRLNRPLQRAGDELLARLPLFFVPAGVGVMGYLHVLREQALPVLVGMTVPWLIALLTSAGAYLLGQRLLRIRAVPGGDVAR